MFNLNCNQPRVLASAFSKSVIYDLVDNAKGSSKLNGIIEFSEIKRIQKEINLCDVFDIFYKHLLSCYRHEYIYKNAIATKIVKGRHKFSNTSYYTEYRVRNVIADCVVVNGSATAYEIKTELDSFARLDKQLSLYSQTFEKNYIVIPESKVSSVPSSIPANTGIIVLTDEYTLSEYKKAESNIESLSHDLIFDCLLKNEYEKLIINNFNNLPDVKPAYLRRECKKLFSLLSKETVNSEFKSCLKNRRPASINKLRSKGLPDSLLSIGMTVNLKQSQYEKLKDVLSTPI